MHHNRHSHVQHRRVCTVYAEQLCGVQFSGVCDMEQHKNHVAVGQLPQSLRGLQRHLIHKNRYDGH